MNNRHRFKFTSFILFGSDIQKITNRVIDESNEKIREAKYLLEQTKIDLINNLNLLDQKRIAAYSHYIEPFRTLYSTEHQLQKFRSPQSDQARRLSHSAPTCNALIELKNLQMGLLTSIFTGVVVGTAALMIFQSLTTGMQFASAIGITVIVGVLLSMRSAYRTAKINYDIAQNYKVDADKFDNKVKKFISDTRYLPAECKAAVASIELVSKDVREELTKLNQISNESERIATLLRHILEMPILDVDGALIPEVIDQIEQGQKDIQQLCIELAMDPPNTI